VCDNTRETWRKRDEKGLQTSKAQSAVRVSETRFEGVSVRQPEATLERVLQRDVLYGSSDKITEDRARTQERKEKKEG